MMTNSSTIENIEALTHTFLSHLSNVKAISPGRYLANCPAHDDRKPSLGISEKPDRLLLYCWAGCLACDILTALGLSFQNLFVDGRNVKRTHIKGERRSKPLPYYRWDWRSQCAELERLIQSIRERNERVFSAAVKLDYAKLSDSDVANVWTILGPSYERLERCDRLDESLFDLQRDLRAREKSEVAR